MVSEGRFREDLYYRLKGIEIDIPPLRARGVDVGDLARHFLRQVAGEHNTPVRRLTDSAVEALARHSWPGNVRELENVIRSVTLLADGDEVDAGDLADYLDLPSARASVRVRAPIPPAVISLPPPIVSVAPPAPERERELPADHDDLSDIYGRALRSGLSLKDLKRRIELECITRALADSRGNITRAAERLGMKRPRLSQLLKEHGIAARVEE
jgi:DNA-binding NtrC family response regulator